MSDQTLTAPRGIRNNNPGNLEKDSNRWQGLAPIKQQTDPAFWIFTKPMWGIRAIGVNFLSYQRRDGLKTLRQMISKWAPPEDNDTEAYIADVAKRTGIDPAAPVVLKNNDQLRGIVLAIIWHENGQMPYPSSVIDNAMALVEGQQ